MSNYNPQRILQLLQICSWKSESALGFSGFAQLETKIKQSSESADDLPEVQQKYLADLYKKARDHFEAGTELPRRPEFITAILNYIGFSHWKAFESALISIEKFCDYTKINVSKYHEKKAVILTNFFSKKLIEKSLNYALSTLDFPIAYEGLNSNRCEEFLKELEYQMVSVPFVILAISDEWEKKLSHPLEDEKLKGFLSSGRLIPVRIGETLAEQFLVSKTHGEETLNSGQVGLLMALSCIHMSTSAELSNSKKVGGKFFGKIEIGTLNNSGTIFTGDIQQENHGGNNAGGNIIQNFYNKDDE